MIKLLREAAHDYPWFLKSIMGVLALAFIITAILKIRVPIAPAPPAGDYPYICSFPGHHLIMRGVMKVK